MKKNYILFGAVVIVLIIICVGFFVYQNFLVQKKSVQPNSQNTQQVQIQQQPIISEQKQTTNPQVNNNQTKNQIAVLKTFKDEYGFQMQYSPDKSVMNTPTSKIIACNNLCPAEVVVNGIVSAYTNQTINSVDYCIYSGAKTTGGISYNDFLFLTIKNNNCYGLDVSYSGNGNRALISQALSTIKFVK